MPVALRHEHGNIYGLEIRGTLRRADFAECERMLATEIERIGPVRLLVLLEGFQGWEAPANWNDLTFYVKHGDSIERIAIVGDERWRSEALMFASADLRRGPVEFFITKAIADARAWLAA
jgi:stage II sporulation SpoAA-like protein